MAHIPMGDVQHLWDKAPHTWSALGKYAREHQRKQDGIAEYLMIELPEVAEQMGDRSFPTTPEQLYETLNEKLKDMPHHTTEARAEMGSEG